MKVTPRVDPYPKGVAVEEVGHGEGFALHPTDEVFMRLKPDTWQARTGKGIWAVSLLTGELTHFIPGYRVSLVDAEVFYEYV